MIVSKKHTNTCNDCIHLATCCKIEHFGRDLETNLPCREFIGINDRVEVVRCRDCKYYDKKYHQCKLHSEEPDQYSTGFIFNMQEDDFCSYGERRE